MTADERLARIQVKIDRAKHHLQELTTAVRAFHESWPYVVHVRRDPETRRPIYYVASVKEAPSTIAAIAGDVLQNLRSALDQLAYQLVIVGTGAPGPFRGIYFPIADDLAAYQASKTEKVKGMRPDAIAAIDALKPYRGGHEMLWRLHKLNIIDKHRLLITVGSRFDAVNIGPVLKRGMAEGWWPEELELFLKPADRLFPLKAGDELFSDAPDSEVNSKITFKLEVAFHEPDIVDGERPVEMLRKMVDQIGALVASFASLLG
jgi:hypothetical protein